LSQPLKEPPIETEEEVPSMEDYEEPPIETDEEEYPV